MDAGLRIEGLRLDAVDAIVDDSPVHLCAELKERVGDAVVISEIAIGDRRPIEQWGHDAQWDDTLHHALHALLTGERDGYYAEYGSLASVARALQASSPRLVACAQNHDQIGNRAFGDRLPEPQHRVALGTVLFSSLDPARLHGGGGRREAPVSVLHGSHRSRDRDCDPGEAQEEEFAAFTGFGSELPDPQAETTFVGSKLDRRPVDDWFRDAVARRRELPDELEVETLGEHVLWLRRGRHSLTIDFAALTLDYGA